MRGRHELPRGMLVFVALALLVSGCASGTQATSGTQASSSGTDSAPAGGAHGGRVPWSEEVARKMSLHVKAKVLSRETMRYGDDPFWPLKDDPFYEQDRENWEMVWNLQVAEWLKGVSTDEIRVTRFLQFNHHEGKPIIGEHAFIEPGETYIFYLELNGLVEFGPGDEERTEEASENLTAHAPFHHWYLGRAERLEEATFPGAGADEE